tara:strand:- start:44 stop:385 length:342 start_codon:yes stop_codon:yes gene_type:complete
MSGFNDHGSIHNINRCAGGSVPNVRSGVSKSFMSDSTATTSILQTQNLGYVGYCHRGIARVWSKSLTQSIDEAKAFIQDNPRYLTRQGLFIYELIKGKEKKFIKKVNKSTKCN